MEIEVSEQTDRDIELQWYRFQWNMIYRRVIIANLNKRIVDSILQEMFEGRR